MDALTEIQQKEFLGREFLTWLWFWSDTHGGRFDLKDGKSLQLWIDTRIVLATDPEKHVSTVTWTGETDDFREARVALTEGKKVVEARFVCELDGERWMFTLDSVWLQLKSLRPPKVEKDGDEETRGLLLEKVHLVRVAGELLEGLCRHFVRRRLADTWKTRDLPALRKWVRSAGGETVPGDG